MNEIRKSSNGRVEQAYIDALSWLLLIQNWRLLLTRGIRIYLLEEAGHLAKGVLQNSVLFAQLVVSFLEK